MERVMLSDVRPCVLCSLNFKSLGMIEELSATDYEHAADLSLVTLDVCEWNNNGDDGDVEYLLV